MKIHSDAYTIEYHADSAELHMQGIMRLKGEEYAPLAKLLEDILQQAPTLVSLDLRQLEALNSSGITVLAKFIAQINRQNRSSLVVLASPTIAWQKKSLSNFQRLMPTLQTSYQQEQVMEINGEDFKIIYNPAAKQVHFQGIIRLHGTEYRDIEALLEQVLQATPAQITLDLRSLKSLNSSGITTLARFVAKLNKQADSSLIIQVDNNIAWQKKSVKNFQRLMPSIEFDWSAES